MHVPGDTTKDEDTCIHIGNGTVFSREGESWVPLVSRLLGQEAPFIASTRRTRGIGKRKQRQTCPSVGRFALVEKHPDIMGKHE